MVNINGAPLELAENIKAHLNISQYQCTSKPATHQRLLKRMATDIHRAAKALGYYRMNFEPSIQPADDCWTLLLKISPGEIITVDNMDVSVIGDGHSDETFARYINKLPLKTGSPLNHNAYEQIKTGLSEIAAARGYFNAKFVTTRLLIDIDNYQANAEILYDTGSRIRFGPIQYPDTVLSPGKLKRYTTFKQGDFYNVERITELQRNLGNSQYFSRVSVLPQTEIIEDNQVPIKVELSPRKQHSYRFGAGFATDTGPRLRFSYENRYLNDKGHKLKYDLSLSPVRSETNLNYTKPLKKPATEQLNFYIGFLKEDTDSSDKEVSTLGSGYTRLLGKGWLQTLFLNFQREDSFVSNDIARTDLLIPGISWSKTSTSDLLFPLKGWRLQTRLRTASEDFGSDVGFSQAYLSGKVIKKLGPGRLLTRLELGLTDVSQFTTLPASIRFFAGGDNSVRGYDYQALGPIDDSQDVIGGSHLVTGSLEYDFRISPGWAIAGFYDQGNAFDSGDDTNLKRGAGLGIRWLSPIGPIRLDVAKALDDSKDIRIHLSMGPDL